MLTTLRDTSPATMTEIAEEMRLRRTTEVFLLFSLGSQFDHLIAMALAKLRVYCLVADPGTISAADVSRINPKGIILSGGPLSAYEEDLPFDRAIFDLGIPVLGICLGFQLWAHYRGALVISAAHQEYGVHELQVATAAELFAGLPEVMPVLENHGDIISQPGSLSVLASTDDAPIAAARLEHLWGVQFHPEVTETIHGPDILGNFCFGICQARDQFPAEEEALRKMTKLSQQVSGRAVLLALSGGSDSSVVAYLLKQVVAQYPTTRVSAVYIKGIDRPDDEARVHQYFGIVPWLTLRVIDASDRFLAALAGATTMQDKRRAMKRVYQAVLQEHITQDQADYIAQGTLYTDISESGGGYQSGAPKATIKEHHNVGLKFSVPELTPLADCVKDNARDIGRAIGVPEELLANHPFPGPGLIVRIEGEITPTKLALARQVDGIWIDELRQANLYREVWQAGAVIEASLVPCNKGDGAMQGFQVRLWAVTSVDGFTAQPANLPGSFLFRVARRIGNEIRAIGSIDYRISGKPPSTIESG